MLTHKTMILISKINHKLLLLLLLGAFFPVISYAQSALSLSISPTLFDMTANPEQEWVSTIRVINSNPYDISVYVSVVNFTPKGEGGIGEFVPVNPDESQGQTLAEWISTEGDDLLVPAERTIDVPLHIKVPEDAPPGGHYAAVLIGTKSLNKDEQKTLLETSQVVTSLVFLKVTGDVVEKGSIRSFRALDSIVEKPEMTFELRFQNDGNVHLLPQGEIKILNMWGQERGIIPVNQKTLFGNVLPNQIRKYSFSWTGEWSLSDMGRYTAMATLGYGADSKQFVSSKTAFWFIPWKIAGSILLGVFLFVYIMMWAIKLYIRKMLSMAGVSTSSDGNHVVSDASLRKKVTVVSPIEEGMLDLRVRLKESNTFTQKISSLFLLTKKYKIFLGVLLLFIMFVTGVVIYIKKASVPERGYEVTVGEEGQGVEISSEQVQFDKMQKNDTPEVTSVIVEECPPLKLVNRSGVSGLAAKLGVELESYGYEISDLSTEFSTKENNTVIVYNPDFMAEAIELSGKIKNTLLSAYSNAPENEPITVYVGQDYQDEL